jgi:DNA-binding CsgD family transcriptional regulator
MITTSPLYSREELEHFEHIIKSSDNLMPVLAEIGQSLSRTSHPYTLAYLNYLSAVGFGQLGNLHKAATFVQSAEMHARQAQVTELTLKIKALSITAGIAWRDKREVKATALELIASADPASPIFLNTLNHLIGQSLSECNYTDALAYAYELLNKATACNTLPSQFTAYTKLGFIHIEVNETHLAEYYLERAYEISQVLPQRRFRHYAMGNLAYVNGRLGNLDKSAELLRKMIRDVKNSEDANFYLPRSYMNLSNIYLLRENIKRAWHYHELALKYSDSNDPEITYQLVTHGAEIQIAGSQYDTAILSLQHALAIGEKHEIQHLHRHILKLLSLTYEQLGEASLALATYKEYTRLTMANHKAVLSAQKLLGLRTDFSLAQDRFKQEHKHITYLQETVSEQELAIADLSVKLSLKEKILHDFWHDLRKESPHVSSHFSELLKLSKLIEESKRHLVLPAERKRLANKYSQALASLHPSLTPTELQVLVCARLGLSSIETAEVMKTSDRTVEHHRHSARKKMSLPRTTSLTTYLTSIDADHPA